MRGCWCFESYQTIARFEKMGDLFEPVLKLKQKLPDLKTAAVPSAVVKNKPIELAAQADDDHRPKKAPGKTGAKKAPARKKRSKV